MIQEGAQVLTFHECRDTPLRPKHNPSIITQEKPCANYHTTLFVCLFARPQMCKMENKHGVFMPSVLAFSPGWIVQRGLINW
jgi:hypothetical protein